METVRYDSELICTIEAVRRKPLTWGKFFVWFLHIWKYLSEYMMTLLVATVFNKCMMVSHMKTLNMFYLVIY